MKLKIGTRGSKLALWQAYYVADLLKKGSVETEIVTIDTKGDKKQDVAIAEIGTKGVFTEEIEAQLKAGVIDMGVHSAKDMQSELPEDFELVAFTEREKVHDVLVGHKKLDLQNPHQIITLGTSSARRKALFQHYYPHIRTIEIRGNLQTRIAKMEAGLCDAIVLAYAGIHRMEYDNLIVHEFSTEQFIPAVGQGSITVEVLSAMPSKKKALIRQFVNHPETEQCIRAERAFLKTLRGGCSIPVFALGELSGKDLHLRGGVIKLDGKEKIQESISGPSHTAENLGNQLAQRVLQQGGDAILEEIKKQLQR